MPKRNKTQKKKQNGKKKGAKMTSVGLAISSIPGPNLMSVNGRKTFVLNHSEMVDTFDGSPNFQDGLIGYRINPGNSNLFPWLGSIAPAFEKYTIRKLAFRWVPHCPMTVNGVFSMAVDYDAADEAPHDRASLMAYKTRTTFAPYTPGRLVCAPQDLRSTIEYRYVLAPNPLSPDAVAYPSHVDRRLYDLGYVWMSLEANGVAFGDLWVDYEVELTQPDVNVFKAVDVVATAHANNGCSKNDPLGTIIWDYVGHAFNGLAKSVVANKSLLKIPNGLLRFINSAQWFGTGMANNINATLTDASGVEQKSYGTVTKGVHTGDAGTEYVEFDVNIDKNILSDVYLAYDATAATTITGMLPMRFYPWSG